MPQKVIKFTGINRSVNEFQGSGACEELINIRSSIDDKKIVKSKKVQIDGIKYDFYAHTFGNNTLFLGVHVGDMDDDGTYSVKIYHLNKNGGVKKTLGTLHPIDATYSVAFVGNKAVFSFVDNYTTLVYEYIDGEYEEAVFVFPYDFHLKYKTIATSTYSTECTSLTSDLSPNSEEFKSEALKQWSAIFEKKDFASELTGPSIVALNVSLEDGTELWTNQIVYVNPYINEAVKVIFYETSDIKMFEFTACEIEFTIPKNINFSSNNNKIKNINVYASRPVFPWDINDMRVETDENGRVIYGLPVGISKTEATKQLLYFQKSIPVSDIVKGDVVFKLNFGNTQAGERVLNIDGGPVIKWGYLVSYNNRLHSYNSKSIINPQYFTCLANTSTKFSSTLWNAYVYLKCANETIVISTKAVVNISDSDSMDTTKRFNISCCYPDSRATKILLKHPSDTSDDFTQINTQASDSYNYAYGEGEYKGTTVNASDIKITPRVISDDNVIYVSDQYNPFSFPVDKVYSVGGSVLDITTSYLPISSTQVGQYPLTVFTSNGIFSMEQGDGSVLYSNITPLQPIVINGKATTTPYGTFFISSKSVYQLSGRDLVNISDVLNGKREVNLRNLESYKRLCFNENEPLYDFSDAVSSKDFEEFITDCCLTYDQSRNELYIGGTANGSRYSYVFNLNTNMFHKVGKVYMPSHNGARYVIEITGETRNVVDLFTEEDSTQPIFLQSRPISLEVLYTHISRLLLNVDAHLSGDEYLCLSVFGSDNLHDWKCIISSQKRNAILRHMRTNRAAKSYKDYIILINGVVHSDTDISDIITDYTVVNRRLG